MLRPAAPWENIGMRWILIPLMATLPVMAADNQLTAAEKAAGWRLLFDGRTFANWQDPAKENPVSDSFVIEDGCLKSQSHPKVREDLFTLDTFGNFELEFDWKIAPAGNSGVKYKIQDHLFVPEGKTKFEDRLNAAWSPRQQRNGRMGEDYVVGFEYQLTDNINNPDARDHGPKYQTGALYSIEAPSKDVTRPVGEFNHSRLVVRGEHVEHWLNGEKVLEFDLTSPAVAASMAKRWGPDAAIYKSLVEHSRARCPISLQNHNDVAWFKNIKVRELK
jgi:hypothetical protein